MKKRFTLLAFALLVLLAGNKVSAQTFWTENFESGSTGGLDVTGYTGPNGTWTMTITGSEGDAPNIWYVSCAENGHTSGVCGTGCAGVTSTATGATLHLGANATGGSMVGDAGATYDAGGLCGLLWCTSTDRRAESPTINCTSKFGITLSFNYLENGDGTNDDGTVWYYDGSTWSLLVNTAKTPVCPSTQGRWQNFSIALPASADNNPNVKIGFRWVNNDDGVGTDPSYAIDSLSLSTVASGVPVISANPTASTICVSGSTSFIATVTGATSYQWQRSTTGTGGSFVNITAGMDGGIYGASYNTTTLTITGASLADNGYAYQLVATNGSGSVTSTPALLTVTSTPSAGTIVGPSNVCVGDMITLSDGTTGGTWSSSASGTASVGSTGIVSGTTAGSAVISYTVVTSCGTAVATFDVTVVTSASAGSITGSTTVCVGGATTLADATTGGTWSSASSAVATVSGTGVVTGVAVGVDIISYEVSTSCGSATVTYTITVDAAGSAGTITGPSNVCEGAVITMADGTTGGSWSTTNTNASVTTTGAVTGITPGTDTVVYTIVGGLCGSISSTMPFNILGLPHPVIHTLPGHVLAVNATYLNYQWLKNGTIIAGATNATYTFTITANYQVIVDSGSCYDTSNAHTFNLAVGNLGMTAASFHIMQDGGMAVLFADAMLSSDIDVKILDLSGRQIGHDTWPAGTTTFRINDYWYPTGIYLLRLTTDQANVVLKWQKD